MLLKHTDELGLGRWTEVAKRLAPRTDNQVPNVWFVSSYVFVCASVCESECVVRVRVCEREVMLTVLAHSVGAGGRSWWAKRIRSSLTSTVSA